MNPIKPIKTEADYDAALIEIDTLMDAASGPPEGDQLDILVTLLVTLVEGYEARQGCKVRQSRQSIFSRVASFLYSLEWLEAIYWLLFALVVLLGPVVVTCWRLWVTRQWWGLLFAGFILIPTVRSVLRDIHRRKMGWVSKVLGSVWFATALWLSW